MDASSICSQLLRGGNLIGPAALADCLDSDGNLNVCKHRRLLSDQSDLVALHHAESSSALAKFFVDDDDDADDADDCGDRGPRTRKRRKGERGALFYTDVDGVRRVLPPTQSLWHNLHVDRPCLDLPQFHVKFRKRFRMPHTSFLELVGKANNNDLFKRWKDGTKDAIGNPCAPLSLLVLASLRHIGRSWTFDDLEESTAASEEVTRCFFHQFIQFGSVTLFQQCVTPPLDLCAARAQEHEFCQAGLPGCIGSMDATHVAIEKCSFRLRQAHLAQKLPYTARTCNLVVNHRRRILSTTSGHPARWNDKSLVKFDPFVMGMRRRELLQDLTFELCDRDGESNIIRRQCKGAWLLVDNGCHNWIVAAPPIKSTTLRTEIRFSQWLESMRKDVECTFGMLKGKWRILKSGIRLGGLEECDQVWKTCCALHNMLLEVDGLDEKWEDGVVSDWQRHMGENDAAPEAIRRLLTPAQARNYDTSAMGRGSDCVGAAVDDNCLDDDTDQAAVETETDGRIVVGAMKMKAFRKKLITHFNIAFQKREVVWPKRNGPVRANV